MATEDTLESWNFLRDYANHREELIDQARFVYSFAKQLKGTPPTQEDCKTYYGDALDGSRLFDTIVHKKRFLKREYYRTFAFLLAEYVIEKDWASIQKP